MTGSPRGRGDGDGGDARARVRERVVREVDAEGVVRYWHRGRLVRVRVLDALGRERDPVEFVRVAGRLVPLAPGRVRGG